MRPVPQLITALLLSSLLHLSLWLLAPRGGSAGTGETPPIEISFLGSESSSGIERKPASTFSGRADSAGNGVKPTGKRKFVRDEGKSATRRSDAIPTQRLQHNDNRGRTQPLFARLQQQDDTENSRSLAQMHNATSPPSQPRASLLYNEPSTEISRPSDSARRAQPKMEASRRLAQRRNSDNRAAPEQNPSRSLEDTVARTTERSSTRGTLAGSTAQLSETSSSGRGTDDVRNVNRNIGSSAGGDESSGHESKGSGNNQQSQSGGAQSGGAQDSDPAGHAAAQRAAELAETQHRETQRRDAERREAEQRVAQERERQQQEQRERESRTSRKRGRDADSQAEIETPEVDEDTASGMRRRKATIKARIAPNGQVMQAWVAQSSGSSSYDNLCLEKIKGGRYKAAIRDGKPVKTVITRTFALGQ